MKKCHPKGHQRPKAIRVGGSGPACRPWAGWRRGCGASGTQRQRGMRERSGVRLQVGGLPPAVIPVRMAVVGCPISSQRTTYYTTDQTQREPIIRYHSFPTSPPLTPEPFGLHPGCPHRLIAAQLAQCHPARKPLARAAPKETGLRGMAVICMSQRALGGQE